jgi:hypothetical protein
MEHIKADIIKSCTDNRDELPIDLEPKVLAEALEMIVTSIARLVADPTRGPVVSKVLGMDAASLDMVRRFCKNGVLTMTKGDLLKSISDHPNFTRAEAVYAGYWVGIFDGRMSRG